MLLLRGFLILMALTGCGSALAASYVPPSDDTVLAKVLTQRDPSARALAALRQKISASPNDVANATAYAEAAIKIGHARADPRYYGYAEAALAPWWASDDAPQTVLVLRATIRQFFHAFDQARADLDRALAHNPQDAQARLIRATVLQVQGYPQQALADCEQLAGKVESLLSTSCAASAASLMGRAKRSQALLDYVLEQSSKLPSEARLWAETLQAEIAERLGDTAGADAAYARALTTMQAQGSTDAYLLAAWADFAIAHGKSTDVVARLSDLTDIDNLLLRLTLAEKVSGANHTAYENHRAMLDARFAAARQRGEAVHLREEAMFQLDIVGNATRALELAQADWAVQREPLDALTLLRAAHAAHQPDAAAPVLEWIKTTGLEDQRLTAVAGALP